MKKVQLGLSVCMALTLLGGCGTQATVTNGGISTTQAGKTGVQSSNGKAQTGSVMMMNQSNMPPALARKSGGVAPR